MRAASADQVAGLCAELRRDYGLETTGIEAAELRNALVCAATVIATLESTGARHLRSHGAELDATPRLTALEQFDGRIWNSVHDWRSFEALTANLLTDPSVNGVVLT